MKLQILYTPGFVETGHISISAYSTKEEVDASHIKSFILNFGNMGRPIHANRRYQRKNNTIELEVPYSFEALYQWVHRSKYRFSKNYNSAIFSGEETTCATAVKEVLSQVGIELDLPKKRFKHLQCCLWWRTSIITPREVYEALLEYCQRESIPHQVINDETEKLLNHTFLRS